MSILSGYGAYWAPVEDDKFTRGIASLIVASMALYSVRCSRMAAGTVVPCRCY